MHNTNRQRNKYFKKEKKIREKRLKEKIRSLLWFANLRFQGEDRKIVCVCEVVIRTMIRFLLKEGS